MNWFSVGPRQKRYTAQEIEIHNLKHELNKAKEETKMLRLITEEAVPRNEANEANEANDDIDKRIQDIARAKTQAQAHKGCAGVKVFNTEEIDKLILKAEELAEKEKMSKDKYFIDRVVEYLVDKNNAKFWKMSRDFRDSKDNFGYYILTFKKESGCGCGAVKISRSVKPTGYSRHTIVYWHMPYKDENNRVEWDCGEITFPDYEILKGSTTTRDKIYGAIATMLENKANEMQKNGV